MHRRSRFASGVLVALVCAVAVSFGAGCGEDDQEAAFREAGEELAESQEGVAKARARVGAEESEVAEAEAELTEAREALTSARERLAKARAEVGLHATDDVLFREIQGRLLDDSALAEVAVSARVEKGVVTLTGEVEEGSQRDRAGEIAESVPGVMSVENRIAVGEPVS